MDINTLRTGITVASFLIFIAIIAWAVSPRNRGKFDQAALVPFTEDDAPVRVTSAAGK